MGRPGWRPPGSWPTPNEHRPGPAGRTAGRQSEDYRRLDSRLHLAIAEAAGSPSLVPLVAENRMRVNALLDRILLLQRNISHSDEQHEAVVNAICR